jgi:hypothetical protein
MDYNPFEGIDLIEKHKVDNYAAWVETQNRLRALVVPSMDGVQIKSFVSQGMTIDANGVVTLDAPPASSVEISAHLADDDIHGSHAATDAAIKALTPYALRRDTADYLARATLPANHKLSAHLVNISHNLTMMACIGFLNDSKIPLISWHDSAGDVLIDFGIDDNSLYITVGTVTYWSDSYFYANESTAFTPGPVVVGVSVGVVGANVTARFFCGGAVGQENMLDAIDLPNGGVSDTLTLSCHAAHRMYWAAILGKQYPAESYHTPPCKGIQYLPMPIVFFDFHEKSGATLHDIAPLPLPRGAAMDLTIPAGVSWVAI